MKIILAILSIALITNTTQAAPLNLGECLKDHRSILYRHAYQVHSEVERLIHGISVESSRGAPASKIKKLKSLLGRLIIKEYVIHDVIRQTRTALSDQQLMSDPRAAYLIHDIIDTDEIALNTKSISEKTNPAVFLLKTYKTEVVNEFFIDLSEEIFHSAGNGTFLKVMSKSFAAEAIEGTLIRFGSNVLKGAGISAALCTLATPLTGARLSPEDLWLKMLEKRPELIINPEWMNEAGSPDAPWFAHCSALQKKEKKIAEVVKTLVQKEESSFLNKIAFIEESYQKQTPASSTAAVADNTRVQVQKTLEQRVPYWALQI